MRRVLFWFAVAAPVGAIACPNGAQTLVSCSLRQGALYLETCLLGDYATYAYGKTGLRPELALARPVTQVDMTPWPGIGRYIWEDFTFFNGDVSYQVFYSIDKLAEAGSGLTAGLTVRQGAQTLAEFSCDEASVVTAGYGLPLFEAKQLAGQIYSLETQSWVE